MSRFPTRNRQAGFSLLELTVVVVLIGILAAIGIKYFLDAMDRARATSVEMLAWRFANSASILHAWRSIPLEIESQSHGVDGRGVHWVVLEGTTIYLNANGWPATTDSTASPAVGEQTAGACTQLLNAIMKQPIEHSAGAQSPNDDYKISAIDGRICRYQLIQNRDDPWFFDYNLETGRVKVSVPKLSMEQYARG